MPLEVLRDWEMRVRIVAGKSGRAIVEADGSAEKSQDLLTKLKEKLSRYPMTMQREEAITAFPDRFRAP